MVRGTWATKCSQIGLFNFETSIKTWIFSNRILSTIEGNVKFIHSQYSSIFTSQVSTFLMFPRKLLTIVIIMCLSYRHISETLCSLFSAFTLFYLILENVSTNERNDVFFVIFHNYDVMYNRSISLLPPIILDNLFLFFNLESGFIITNNRLMDQNKNRK